MKSSLIKKTVFLIVCIAIIIGTFAIAIYNKGLYDTVIAQYEHYSIDITKLVAVEIDAERVSNVQKAVKDIYDNSENKVTSDQWGTPEFEAYLSQFESIKEMDDYKAIHAELQKMQDELDVDCLYIVWVDTENQCSVYLVDAAHEEPCPPGCIDPIYVDNKEEVLRDLSRGMEPNITNTPEYGWLLATGMPIYDSQGNIVAEAVVDISMNKAMSQIVDFMIYIGCAFLIMIILVCILAIFLINKYIVKPINTLSRAAADYKNNKSTFSDLKLKRKDEIGVLVDSMINMEKDIDGYVSDLVSAREHAEQMDREAKIDAMTKVSNKRAYDAETKRLDESKNPYGVVLIDMNDLKVINDTYGHEKGDVSIKTVAKTICKVFDPSSVYRVGGDEFIVILENDAYENRVALVNKLFELFKSNKADNSLSPWERVSAAVGYAVFDPKIDVRMETVVQRADDAMYESKKMMKEAE